MSLLRFDSPNVTVVVCDQPDILHRMRRSVIALEEGASDREAWHSALDDTRYRARRPKRKGGGGDTSAQQTQ